MRMGTTGPLCLFLALVVTYRPAAVEATQAVSQPASQPAGRADCGMVFLYHDDARFLEGLKRHGLLHDYGLRLHNTGFDTRPFGQRWLDNPLLQEARTSGRPYYIDRITGGMPYQKLDGIEAIAAQLKDDPNFLGFQVHEWGGSTIHDHRRIQELILGRGLPFDAQSFAPYESRTVYQFFSGGDYETYRDLHWPLKTYEDVYRYYERYFRQLVDRTAGQIVSVSGYEQLSHAALRWGARNVMVEIGNQVPLTAMQIAGVRGAARQYGKPFGVYYEPWGGRPFGCPCALGWSPWFPGGVNPDKGMMDLPVRPELGSSRSLHRRLLYFAWLSGAAYIAEEWGAENYFANWSDYPLTDYGRVVQEFRRIAGRYGRPVPVVPAALVMPSDAQGIDLGYVGGYREQVYRTLPPDGFHLRVRDFARRILASRPRRSDSDDFNLTASPWIGSFDVLSGDVQPSLLAEYGLVIYFDAQQADRSPVPQDRRQAWNGNEENEQTCRAALVKLQPVRVEGEVGVAQARSDGHYLVGVFNNLGVRKASGKETTDPQAVRSVVVHAPGTTAEFLLGEAFVKRRTTDRIEMALPAGEVALLFLPDSTVLPGSR